MTAPNTSDSSTSTPTGATGTDAAAQAAADRDAQQERDRLALEDRARADAELARETADRAAGAADLAAERAERVVSDTEETEQVTLRRSLSVSLPGGGTRTYGPGTVTVPKFVGDIVRAAPTFATSGRPAVDSRVRRAQERNFGIHEVVTQEDSTHRTLGGEANAVGGDDQDDEKGLEAAELRASGGQGAGRGRGSRARYSEAQQASAAELNELTADEVEKRYTKAVRDGKVKPIPDGQGSGANGNVLKADQVDALARAGA